MFIDEADLVKVTVEEEKEEGFHVKDILVEEHKERAKEDRKEQKILNKKIEKMDRKFSWLKGKNLFSLQK